MDEVFEYANLNGGAPRAIVWDIFRPLPHILSINVPRAAAYSPTQNVSNKLYQTTASNCKATETMCV